MLLHAYPQGAMESTQAHLQCAQLQHAMHAIGSMHAQLQHAMSASAHLQGNAEVWQLVASVVFPPEPAILALGVLFQAGVQVAVAGPEPTPVMGVLVELPAKYVLCISYKFHNIYSLICSVHMCCIICMVVSTFPSRLSDRRGQA